MLKSQGRLERGLLPRRRQVEARAAGALSLLHSATVALCIAGLASLATPVHAQSLGAPVVAPVDSAAVSDAGPEVDAGLVQLPNAGTATSQPLAPPADLHDLGQWLDFKLHSHVESLPYQARLFYRRGLLLKQSGDDEEALRLVHGAIELDPGYVAPRLTLASWELVSNPSQALLHYAIVVDAARRNFLMQLGLGANALYLGLQAVLLALILAGVLLVAIHNSELRHGWYERLARGLSPMTARSWAWAFLIIPFFLGFGPVLPTVVFLGLLWPLLKRNERFVFVMLALFLATAPLTIAALDRLAVPLRDERGPLYGTAMLDKLPYQHSMHERLRRLATAHPDNAFVQFGLGWTARRAGNLDEAESAYRNVLRLWPNNDRALTNLGNVLAMQGRADEALDAFKKAVEVNPSNAAAHFNMSQILTLRFEYRDATNALSRASAVDFDLVKAFQAQQTEDGYLPLVDLWLAPQSFWAAMRHVPFTPGRAPALPPFWRSRLEFSGWTFSIAALLAAILAVVVGLSQHRDIPLRGCSNCGSVVCRRCAERRRERALCPRCAGIEARAESPEFGHVHHLMRTAAAALIPGFGLLSFRRVAPALALFVLCGAIASIWTGMVGPFPYELSLSLPDSAMPMPVLVGSAVVLYVFSLAGYFANVARARAQAASLAAPSRSRARQTTERQNAAAA